MTTPKFSSFFKEITGNSPYDYQSRLAGGDKGRACESQLIDIPTGLGKTAAVVLAWLWNRVHLKRADWPRRLVICLPMRTLVEQTFGEAEKWLNAHKLLWDGQSDHLGKVRLHLLMGGEDAGEWDIHPEAEAILIGTQDMLLSRALNRGYGMSRYRWPMHFALLNNDTLWVCDETQLMGVGVETSAQLAALRASMGAARPCFTWWMSATLASDRLATVDHREAAAKLPRLELSAAERKQPPVRRRIEAAKLLSRAPLVLSAATKKDYAKKLAAFVLEQHRPGSLTLVIVNRVARAQELFATLLRDKKGPGRERLALVHSRFRPCDRQAEQARALALRDGILVATQAIEAGVDISAELLLTELAPWSSLVQRFGRCNRYGEHKTARIVWIDLQSKDDTDAAPYTIAELTAARSALAKLDDAGPTSVRAQQVPERAVLRSVLRRRDLVDLFDTTPDITGADLDVSRYIREGEDQDVQVAWRAWSGDQPPADTPLPERHELCRVNAIAFGKFLDRKNAPRAFTWDPLQRTWQAWDRTRRVLPGRVFVLPATAGGYHSDLGWTGDPGDQPTASTPVISVVGERDAHDADAETASTRWLTLDEHTREVVRATDTLARDLAGEFAPALHTAAVWHDVGKAHPVFQAALRSLGAPAGREQELWAKSGHRAPARYERTGFRHELASALAWLHATPSDIAARDLVAYLIAAHHGKVRLALRPLPDECPPRDRPDAWCVRGIVERDAFGPVSLNGTQVPAVTLTLNFMIMGHDAARGSSWLERTIRLRDTLGPFRLAWLETLLRAADMRASAQ